jgi:hypothetical protein
MMDPTTGAVAIEAKPAPPNSGHSPTPPRFKLVPFHKISVGSERVYLVKGIIPRLGLVVIWGPPNTRCRSRAWQRTFRQTGCS